jgi:hypothetical protein
MTKKTIQKLKSSTKLWSKIKENNNCTVPAVQDYTFPKTTTGSTVSAWFDQKGYYDVLCDPIYSKITLNGYVKFTYQYTVTEKYSKTTSNDYSDSGLTLNQLKKLYPDLASAINKAKSKHRLGSSDEGGKLEIKQCYKEINVSDMFNR